MKQYKMATIPSPSIIKQPLKVVEIPLSKFSEEVIPHHQKILQDHKAHVHKLIALNNTEQLHKEIKGKKRVIKQLRDLLYELDTLRTQVDDQDLDAFDNKTMPLRSSILKLTKTYQDLEKEAEKILNKDLPEEDVTPNDRFNPFIGAAPIECQSNIAELKLQEEQDRFTRLEEVRQNAEDLRTIHRDLHILVRDQGEQVTEVQDNVTSTEENVNRGFRDIIKANKLHAVAYPATGAFVGTLLGGPIGLFLGLKVGGIAAVGCAVAGYAGGRFLKKQKDMEINESEHVINNENNENHTTVREGLKKDI